MHLKNFKKHFKKLQKNQYGLDYLFNEPARQNNSINATNDVRTLLNERRSNLLLKETKKIRKELYKKEADYNYLKEKEQEGSLTNKQKSRLKNIGRYLKKLNKYLKKLNKYHDNVMYGLDCLFNEVNEEDYYEPKEIKIAFDGSYMLNESTGDKDVRLSIDEYFDIIRPYLKDMIDIHKSNGEWKTQLTMRIIFISFIDKNETHVMHTKSDNVKIMNCTDTSDAIYELIDSFMKKMSRRARDKNEGKQLYI